MDGSCTRCEIDNTNVVLAGGSGADAVIAPEMKNFAHLFGFEFFAHAIGHADRKARVERAFHYAENNFLAGRTFTDWDDLNKQALDWCIHVANKKEKRAIGMSPEAAFVNEKPALIPLPSVLPPIYESHQRLVDVTGFIHFETNRYSAPERLIGQQLDVYQYLNALELFYQHQRIAMHKRLIGKRHCRSTIKGHHKDLYTKKTKQQTLEAQQQLSGCHEILDEYIKQLKKNVRGRGAKQFNRLLNLKRTYPEEAFMSAIKQAYQYGLYDLTRLEELILKYIAGDYFNLA